MEWDNNNSLILRPKKSSNFCLSCHTLVHLHTSFAINFIKLMFYVMTFNKKLNRIDETVYNMFNVKACICDFFI